ncbi:hypothetical protein KR222_008904, partial [Zaprionus bogoriensis]
VGKDASKAFAKSTRLLRTPPGATICPSSAPPAISEAAFTFTVECDTPKRSRDAASPTSSPRKTPPKKCKADPSCEQQLEELGSILAELIFMVNEKKPVVRHINQEMKNQLAKMKELQSAV